MREPLGFQGIEIQHVEVRATIPSRINKDALGIRRKSKRGFMPVLGLGQLLRLTAINGDAPQMAIVLATPHQEVDGVALWRKGNLLNQAIGVIHELTVTGLQISDDQVTAAGQIMSESKELAVAGPSRVGVPGGAIGNLLCFSAGAGQHPDFAKDTDGYLCAIRRDSRIFHAMVN